MLRGSVGWVAAWGQGARPGGPVKGEWTSLVAHLTSCYTFKSTVLFKIFKNDLSPVTLLYANYGKI